MLIDMALKEKLLRLGAPAIDRALEAVNKKIVIGINGSCNNDCIFCSSCGSKPELDVRAEEIIRRIDSASLERGTTTIISGGDPTMHRGLAKIISCLKRKGCEIKMMTNARKFFDPVFSKKIARAGLECAITELHSPYPEVHDFLTQRPGSFGETLAGIKNLILCRVDVRVKIIVNRINYRTVPELVEFICRNLPEVSEISITDINITGNALMNKELLSVRFSEAVPHIEKAVDIAERHNMRVGLYAFPICALRPEYYRYSVPREQYTYFKAGNKLTVTAKKYLAKVCQSCDCKDECSGIWRSHIDFFGENEVRPLNMLLYFGRQSIV